ncbi:MAG: hypothetical protein N2595_06600 [bacterium]|nr:hypothetical protein [bacterium]
MLKRGGAMGGSERARGGGVGRRVWIVRVLFEGVSLERVLASVLCGVWLGCMPIGRPVWLAGILVILLTRTHLATVFLGWVVGVGLGWLLKGWYEVVGTVVLEAQPDFWRFVVVQPLVCYFELERGGIMGSVVCGGVAGIVAMVLVVVARRVVRLWGGI